MEGICGCKCHDREQDVYRSPYSGKEVESDDPSNASTHWVVAIEKDNNGYVYTHAVGQVISGKGTKKPFKRIEGEKLKKDLSLDTCWLCY